MVLETRISLLGALGLILSLGLPTSAFSDPPSLLARRTETPPKIDGLLDEPIWDEAPTIANLTQVEPVEGAEPTEPTEVKILYDSDFLYIGIHARDSEPHRIVATQMERDRDLDPDDRIELILDTFLDRRNAFFFQISPGGSQGDALISGNGNAFDKDWDGIWQGRAAVVETGWTAEFEIPFKTLSFDPDRDRWGFNLTRILKRKRETSRWATPRLTSGLFTIGDAGTLTGLSGLEQGLGLDVVPFVLGTNFRDRENGRRFLRGDAGFDVFYRITPGLQASLTVNTDFAETEVDSRRVNLTRFPLFFPEKRDFFLQDKGIFDFGGIRRSPLPFFSRRIGLADDGEIPLLAGVRLTGRAGPYNIGVLDVQTGREGDIDGKNLFVTRISRNVLEQSQVGIIATRGNPTESGLNTLGGADFTYRTSTLFGNKNLRLDAYAMGTATSGSGGDGEAYGVTLRYPNDQIDSRFFFEHIDREFNPALGFVRRKGIRSYTYDFRWRPRLYSKIRRLTFGFNPRFVTDTGNHLETKELEFTPFGIELESGDRLDTEISAMREVLDEPFEIQDDLSIPEGTYDFTRYVATLESGNQRPYSGRTRFSWGTFFSGKRFDWLVAIDARPSRYVTLSFENEENRVRLDEGSFTTRILRARANFTFNPDISWNNFVQFDNESESLGLNSRLRWIFTPGRELKLVLNQAWERAGRDLAPLATKLTAKIEYTLRF